MALPIIPLLVVGLVVVAAAGGKRKRRSASTGAMDAYLSPKQSESGGGEEEQEEAFEGAFLVDHSDARNELFETAEVIPVPLGGRWRLVLEVEARTQARTAPGGEKVHGGELTTRGRAVYYLSDGEIVDHETPAQLFVEPDHAGGEELLQGTAAPFLQAQQLEVGELELSFTDAPIAVYCNLRKRDACTSNGQASFRVGRAGNDRQGYDLWIQGSPGWVGEVEWWLEEN